jgi:hypothetical protein
MDRIARSSEDSPKVSQGAVEYIQFAEELLDGFMYFSLFIGKDVYSP